MGTHDQRVQYDPVLAQGFRAGECGLKGYWVDMCIGPLYVACNSNTALACRSGLFVVRMAGRLDFRS